MTRKLLNKFVVALALAAGLLGPALASAHDYKLGTLAIEHPWAPESIGPAPTGAAYMTVVNGGNEADRLVAASTPRAQRVELHSNQIDDGIIKMRAVKAIEVAPGSPVVLQPAGALHIMLIGVKEPLKEGTRFPMTLTFEKAGSIEVEIQVQKRKSDARGIEHGHHM
jgi:copper(I)-binding protein